MKVRTRASRARALRSLVSSSVPCEKPENVLVGASLGGRLVIEAAASAPAGLAGIVSLSGERTVEDHPDILPAARRVRVPALYVGAREDPLTDGVRQQLHLHAAMGGQLEQV